MKHAEKLSDIDIKIKALQTKKKKLEEKQNVALVNLIKRLGIHNLPEDIVVGALIETVQAFEQNTSILKTWQATGRTFLEFKKDGKGEERVVNPASFRLPSTAHR